MPFTDEQIQRLTRSFQLMEPQLDALVSVFYRRLFDAAPQVRDLFSDDLKSQKEHMTAALLLVAKNIHDLEFLRLPLQRMGATHVGYGAEQQHYPVVRDAMVGALGEVAGYTWTQALADDWSTALDTVAGFMIEGARQADATTKAA